MKFFIKDCFSKHDQTQSSLRIWLQLLKRSLMENLIFCAVTIKVISVISFLWQKFDKAIVNSNPLTIVLSWHKVRAAYLTGYNCFFDNDSFPITLELGTFHCFFFTNYYYESYSITQSPQFSSSYFVPQHQRALCKSLQRQLLRNIYKLFPYVLHNIKYLLVTSHLRGYPLSLIVT